MAFKDDEFEPGLSMREKITQLTSDTACAACHSVINPLGFALENFDAVGRWRGEDVDTQASYVTADGRTIEFDDALGIAEFAIESPHAHRAFVRHLFHHIVKQPPSAFGPDTLDRLVTEFADDEFNVQDLVVRIAVIAATPHSDEANSTETGDS